MLGISEAQKSVTQLSPIKNISKTSHQNTLKKILSRRSELSVSRELGKQEEFHNFVKNEHATHFRASDEATVRLSLRRQQKNVSGQSSVYEVPDMHMLFCSYALLLTVPIAAKHTNQLRNKAPPSFNQQRLTNRNYSHFQLLHGTWNILVSSITRNNSRLGKMWQNGPFFILSISIARFCQNISSFMQILEKDSP